jgi:8-oxo-dGTP diphosphatase
LTQSFRISSYALLVQDSHLLLCRISGSNPSAGEWTLPGGGIDFGEHPEDACRREVFEETGLEIELQGLATVDSETFNYPDRSLQAIRIIYRAKVSGGVLTPELDGSTDMCEWFTREEVESLPVVPLVSVATKFAF